MERERMGSERMGREKKERREKMIEKGKREQIM